MQPPMQDAGQHRSARPPRALQEEQQADRDLAGDADPTRGLAAAGKDGAESHHRQDGERKPIRQEPGELAHYERPSSRAQPRDLLSTRGQVARGEKVPPLRAFGASVGTTVVTRTSPAI